MPIDKRPMLAKIHIAKKDLNISDEVYRDILRRVTKKDSTAKMTCLELEAVISEFKSLGWKSAKPKKDFRKTPSPSVEKIYALWGNLQKIGQVKSLDKSALDAFVKKHTGIDSAQWLNDQKAQKIIEILKQWIKRVEV